MKLISDFFILPFKKGSIFFLLILLLSSSCVMIYKKVKKVKNPNLETMETIYSFLQKDNYDTSKLIVLKDFNSFKEFMKVENSVPNALFFNNKGQFIEYRKSIEDCNAKISDFIIEIQSINDSTNFSALQLSELMPLFEKNINTNEINVLITWAIWMGKINKEKSFEWIKLIKEAQQKGVKINYYLLNCDILESWEGDFDDLKKTKMK